MNGTCFLLFGLAFWLAHILRRFFFGIYFIQLKEYRPDRLFADKKRLLHFLFPKYDALSAILLLFYLISTDTTKKIAEYSILATFVFFGIYAIFLAKKKSWAFPKFTKKATLLFLTSIIALVVLSVVFCLNGRFYFFVLVNDLFLPVGIMAVASIVQLPVILIKNLSYKKARQKVSKHKNLTVIGITGSYGKSSTKEFLYAILSKKYNVLKTAGNNNTEIAVANTINKELNDEHEIFIVEMAAYRKGEIKLICDIVKPKIGVVTGANEQHLGLFGSIENLLSAEGGEELARSLGKNGILILNGDNKYCLDLAKNFDGHKKIYSSTNILIDSDLWATEIEAHKDSISFLTLNREKELTSFKANVLGKHNVQNLLAAILVAKQIGMTFWDISEAVKNIRQKMGGITLRRGRYGINVVDSSYSSNPDGVLADLDYLSTFQGKKAVVMPCLIELGEKSFEIHKKIGRKIAETCELAIITTDDYFESLKSGFDEVAGGKGKKIIFLQNPNDIFSLLTLTLKADDAVLLEGRVPKELINLFIK